MRQVGHNRWVILGAMVALVIIAEIIIAVRLSR
jgi:hypothetical protein